MVNPSNLYAEKIFSEHPIGMWSFDDGIKYLSLITDAQRSLTAWTFTGSATGTNYTTTPPHPKLGTTVTNVAKTSVTSSGTFTATSNYTVTPNADTFAVGFYFYKLTPYITSVRIGYKVSGTTTWSSPISTPEFYEWGFVSTVFSANPTNANIVIEFTYSAPSTSDTVSILINGLTVGNLAEDSHIENLGSQLSSIPTGTGASGSFVQGVEVSRYNSSSDKGYVISKSKAIYGRNTSFPMTFGSENVMVLYPNEVDSPDPSPSLILPAKGFLNENEKYKSRTFEAWIRVKSQTTTPKRIIGPTTGTDGIYVNAGYLMLSVGDNFGSFYVGEWDRPMLIQVVTALNCSKLFLNGELVISLYYETSSLTLSEYDWIGFYCYSDVPRLEVDCVAIYAYEVDKVLALRRFVYGQGVDFPTQLVSRNGGESIIPDYSVSNYANNYTYGDGQRFRFLDGDKLDNINVLSGRISAPAFKLPELRIENGSTYTEEDFFNEQPYSSAANQITNSSFETNTTGWTAIGGTGSRAGGGAVFGTYVYRISCSSIGVVGLYVTPTSSYMPAVTPGQEYTYYIYVKDESTSSDYISGIDFYDATPSLISGSTVYGEAVSVTTDGWTKVAVTTTAPATAAYAMPYTHSTTAFTAPSDGGKAARFDGAVFSLRDDYLHLQPTQNWSSTESHLYFDKISQLTDTTKCIYIVASRLENNASKQILFKIFDKINENFLEVYTITGGTNDIVYKFSYNGTETTLSTVSGNTIGTKFGAGINIDTLISSDTTNGSNLQAFFSTPDRLALYVGGDEDFTADSTFTGKIYKLGFSNTRNLSKISGLFTNGFFSGSASTLDSHTASYTLLPKTFAGNVYLDIATNMYWQESIPLSALAKFVSGDSLLDYLQVNLDYPRPITFSSSEYNTDNSEARVYLTFQSTTATPADVLTFSNSVRVDSTNAIEDTSAYATTSYEMVDGTVIYIPTSINKDSYFVVAHLEVNVGGIKTNPIEIRNIQIASQALSLDETAPTEIGTKGGLKLLGYVASAGDKNPVVLPKDTDPHLYLSANSGITISGTTDAYRGLYLPLNSGESDTFDVAIIQATMKFQLEEFSTSDVLLFEIEKEDGVAIQVYLDALNASQNRAKLLVVKTDVSGEYTNVEYYINGIKTEYPAVSLDEWVTFGIRLTEHFDIANQTAKLKISGPMLLNNISYFQLKAGDEASKIITISRWINVLYTSSTSQTWNAITGSDWDAIVTTSASADEINGLEIDDVYKSFAGTSKIIAAYDTTDKKLKTKSYGYIVYIGSSTDTVTSSPL